MFKKEVFCARLKNLRKEKKLTQKELADILGVSQGSYAKWENGKRELSLWYLCLLAEQFHVSTDYLLGLDEE